MSTPVVIRDLGDACAALRTAAGALWLPRDVVRASGPDALTFLQGQLSQDLAAIAPGGSAWSLLLQPQGKVDALVRVARADGNEEWWLDVDAGWGEHVLERLRRFCLRVKVEFAGESWRTLAVRGPKSAVGVPATRADVTGVVARNDWPGLDGVDVLGADPPWPEGVPEVPLAAWEVVRIECGVPLMGRELTARTIPAEAGIVDRSVSFTKGCYTGQELVARIDSRGGHVARRLRGLTVDDSAAALAPGDAVMVADAEVGSVTSAARRADGTTVALAYVARSVPVPEDGATVGAGHHAARIIELPLLS